MSENSKQRQNKKKELAEISVKSLSWHGSEYVLRSKHEHRSAGLGVVPKPRSQFAG